MEIIEIITFHLNNLEEVLEVSFRTNSDSEDLIRESQIPFSEIDDFGYDFHSENNSDFEGFDNEFDDDLFIDENEILLFLNEYYVLYSDKLPKSDYI